MRIRNIPFLAFIALCGLAVASCGQFKKYLESKTEVHIKDSTVVNIIDSTVVHEKSVYRDYTGLLDTLNLKDESGRAAAKAWVDTTHNILAGELKVEPSKETIRVEYKTIKEYKDSIKVEKIPVKVEVPTTPPWCWRLLIFNIICIAAAAVWIILKLKLK